MENLSTINVKSPSKEEMQEYAQSGNNFYLIASSEVLSAFKEYIQSFSSPHKENVDDNLSKLIFEIRGDLKIPTKEKREDFSVVLVKPRVSSPSPF